MDFGDRYRVLSTTETREGKLDGMIGDCFGWTTLSEELGLDVIGKPESKLVIKLHFEKLGKEFLFAAQLLEFVDHGAAGTKMRMGNKTWVKDQKGRWIGEPGSSVAKPWWKFW